MKSSRISTGGTPCAAIKAIDLPEHLVRACNDNIRQTLKLADAMIRLADQGDADREDVGCGILYGVLRDSAYKLKQLAEKERTTHKEKGWWEKE